MIWWMDLWIQWSSQPNWLEINLGSFFFLYRKCVYTVRNGSLWSSDFLKLYICVCVWCKVVEMRSGKVWNLRMRVKNLLSLISMKDWKCGQEPWSSTDTFWCFQRRHPTIELFKKKERIGRGWGLRWKKNPINKKGIEYVGSDWRGCEGFWILLYLKMGLRIEHWRACWFEQLWGFFFSFFKIVFVWTIWNGFLLYASLGLSVIHINIDFEV